MHLSIQPAHLSNAESMANLSTQLGYETSLVDMQKRLNPLLSSTGHCVLVATKGTSVVGWIHGIHSFRVESDPFVEIAGLVVDETQRRNGIGKRLVEKIAEWAKTMNIHQVCVRCNTLRQESHQFYESMGFTLKKEQKVFEKALL